MRPEIDIREASEALGDEVARFNDRLRAGGVPHRFPASPRQVSLPKGDGRGPYQELYLAVEDGGVVRGGYVLKHHEVWLRDRHVPLADLQLPLSEGVINRAYTLVGPHILLDALRRQPLLYGLGVGGNREPLARLLRAAGWTLAQVPFFFRVVRPYAFLRKIGYLRDKAAGRWMLDLLAFSGMGWLAIASIQALKRRSADSDGAAAEQIGDFDGWAEDLWDAHKGQYGMVSRRDAATLGALYPRGTQRFIRLRVTARGKALGWAVVLDTQHDGHGPFGHVRLGSLVDCFAPPSAAGAVVACATRWLERLGVDLIVSNQSHEAWCRALDAAGYVRGPSNFIFGTSKALTRLLKDAKVAFPEIHLNRGDGDGPINL